MEQTKIKINERTEEDLRKLLEKHENEDMFVCKECGEQLKGMKSVKEHYEKNKHYNYNLKGSNYSVGFL